METRNVFRLLDEAAEKFGSRPALFEPSGPARDRTWKPWTWLEYRTAVLEIAAGLSVAGIQKGDLVALHSETRLEFYLADIGVQTTGAIAAALYTSYPPPEQAKTLQTLRPKAVFVESPRILAAILSAADATLDTRWYLLTGEADTAESLAVLREAGRQALAADPALAARLADTAAPDDSAILYMTSGATGEPKMGLVTHAAIVANVTMGPASAPLTPEDRSIAFLPSAHITQRIAMEMLPLLVGMPVYFSEGLSKLPHEMKSVKPTFLVAPPRVWERMYSSICTEIKKRGAFSQRMFYFGLGMGADAARRRQRGQSVPGWMSRSLAFFDRIAFRQIRERLGGELRMAVSGAAPLGKDMAEFFAGVGLPIYEGYGLTEGGIVTLNPYGTQPRSGSIGKPLKGVELRIAEDGELLFRSPTLFSGYYNAPEATAAILRDGWLHTGDIAEIDADGYVFITGRKKEVLVASNGKKIYPALIETQFKMEPIINQVLLLGDKMPYAAALFTLNLPIAEALPGMDNWKGKPAAELIEAPPVVAELKRIVSKVNKGLAPFEQVRRYRILPRDFSIEDGELTPTMKVRRGRVMENHRRVVSELFAGKEDFS